MTDLDDALRADARRWRAAQTVSLDLESSVDAVALRPTPRWTRRLAVLATVAAAVLVAVGVAVVADRSGGHREPAATQTPSVSSPAPSLPADLGPPPAGQRTLLRAAGRADGIWTVAPSAGRGELYAVCVGGGTITVDMPGHGGFDVDCTSVTSGASLPSLGRTVKVSRVSGQQFRIAVFGP